MTRSVVDFSEVPSREQVPAGSYLFVVENVVLRESKDKIDPDTGEKSQYFNWELTITEGDFEGRRLFMMTSLVKKALWKLRGVLTNLGVELPRDENGKEHLEYDYDDDSKQIIEPELVGCVGTAVVKMGSYNGQERSEVDTILDVNGVDLTRAARANTNGASAPKLQQVGGSAPASDAPRKMTLR